VPLEKVSTALPTVMPDLIGHLKEMCERYARERISPGGAADMLALTIFMESILH
jgi:triphosphoribosyl-dephospho-CoA synthetase